MEAFGYTTRTIDKIHAVLNMGIEYIKGGGEEMGALCLVLSYFLAMLCIGLSIPIYVIYFILNFIRYFLFSIIFNWYSLVIILIIAFCIFIVNIVWNLVRQGVNEGLLPVLKIVVKYFLNPMIMILKILLKLVGMKCPFDEISDEALDKGMPSLYSIVMIALSPLKEKILKPLRADQAADKAGESFDSTKCAEKNIKVT